MVQQHTADGELTGEPELRAVLDDGDEVVINDVGPNSCVVVLEHARNPTLEVIVGGQVDDLPRVIGGGEPDNDPKPPPLAA